MNNIIHDRPPIRHYNPLKAPFSAQNRRVQIVVRSGPMPINRVIRGHDRIRAAVLHSDFEALQIDFPQGAFGYDRVHLAPVLLLVVAGKMLQCGVRSAFNDPPSTSCGKNPCD
ncbi:hypothetical protein D3C77_418080 [compost metagenome]